MLSYLLIPIAYLLGSIPFGLLFTKLAGLGDIRDIGSGNIGTTNVLRTGNKILAAVTLFFDMFKGLMAVSLAYMGGNELVLFASALAVILGHMYPVWLGFKGGKGVATTFGVMLGILPSLGFLMLVLWIGMGFAFKISSLAALTSFAMAPVLAFLLFKQTKLALLLLTINIFVFWKHRENITRLIKGEETKIKI
jgi:glycerol-3-phosphate acyltransferase PlsY